MVVRNFSIRSDDGEGDVAGAFRLAGEMLSVLVIGLSVLLGGDGRV